MILLYIAAAVAFLKVLEKQISEWLKNKLINLIIILSSTCSNAKVAEKKLFNLTSKELPLLQVLSPSP